MPYNPIFVSSKNIGLSEIVPRSTSNILPPIKREPRGTFRSDNSNEHEIC